MQVWTGLDRPTDVEAGYLILQRLAPGVGMANMAWAIERSIENPTEQARIYREPAPAPGVPAPIPANTARYVLSSSVPGNWIPLLPVQTRSQNNNLILRLKRGRMLQIDGGPPTPHPSQSQALNTGLDLLLYDCDVPREGVHAHQVT